MHSNAGALFFILIIGSTPNGPVPSVLGVVHFLHVERSRDRQIYLPTDIIGRYLTFLRSADMRIFKDRRYANIEYIFDYKYRYRFQ